MRPTSQRRTCPACRHRLPGLLGRLTERLLWTERCCHCDVAEPWSYASFEECACRDSCHRTGRTADGGRRVRVA